MENVKEFKDKYKPVIFDEWPGKEYANNTYFGESENCALTGAADSYRTLQQDGKKDLLLRRDNGSWDVYLDGKLIEKHHFAVVDDW